MRILQSYGEIAQNKSNRADTKDDKEVFFFFFSVGDLPVALLTDCFSPPGGLGNRTEALACLWAASLYETGRERFLLNSGSFSFVLTKMPGGKANIGSLKTPSFRLRKRSHLPHLVEVNRALQARMRLGERIFCLIQIAFHLF